MKRQLNKAFLEDLPPGIKRPLLPGNRNPAILHFGVGGFHRSHQASYFQRLIEEDPERYGSWFIAGACILPQDKNFVKSMRGQELLYTLKSSSPEGREDVRVISSITELYYGPEESEAIIDKIASKETHLISFTITEGGYMLDEATGEFNTGHPDIQWDLQAEGTPRTVFGYLARGLQKRRKSVGKGLILLSCDNVQENGQVLKQALLAFLQHYDEDLKKFVQEQCSFPNSMVDRITPVTRAEDKADFEEDFRFRDECLVISEEFCQWIIELNEKTNFPPLDLVGVLLVKDVQPYEKMKLRILNGGHSLVGLLGKALGYEYIHTAVKDEHISRLFDRYIAEEAIPSLDPIENLSFTAYQNQVKNRFGNELIRDTTDRIISQSSAKIPKFILPVMEHSLTDKSKSRLSSLVIAAWWYYLQERAGKGRSAEIDDALQGHWNSIFENAGKDSVTPFLETREVFGKVGMNKEVQDQIKKLTTIIESEGMAKAILFVLDLDK